MITDEYLQELLQKVENETISPTEELELMKVLNEGADKLKEFLDIVAIKEQLQTKSE